MKRFDNRPGIGPGGLPPLTTVPIAGERCSSRLESALDQMKRRKRTQLINLDTPPVKYVHLRIFMLDTRHMMARDYRRHPATYRSQERYHPWNGWKPLPF